MRKLKVWGLNLFRDKGEQKRYLIAASSQKDAARIAEFSLHYLRGYAAETGKQ